MHSKFGLFQMSSLSLCAALSKVNFVVYYNSQSDKETVCAVFNLHRLFYIFAYSKKQGDGSRPVVLSMYPVERTFLFYTLPVLI